MTRHPRPILRTFSAIAVPRLLKASALALGLLAGGLAKAEPTILYAQGAVVGIENLVVGSTNYDVSFVFGSYDSVFSSSAPTFLNDRSGAYEATDAIFALLDAEPAAAVGDTASSSGSFLVAFDDDYAGWPNHVLVARAVYNDGVGAEWIRLDFLILDRTLDSAARNRAFAVFTADPQNTVPEPTAPALVGAGLAALALARRRRA